MKPLGDIVRHILLLSFVAIPCCRAQVPKKDVFTVCTYNEGEGYMTIHALVSYNGDPVDKLLILDGDSYNGFNENTDCDIAEIDTDTRFFEGGINIDGTTRTGGCGGRIVQRGGQLIGQWTFEVRQAFERDIYMLMDQRYIVTCSIAGATNTQISTSVRVIGEDSELDAVRLRPESRMLYQAQNADGTFGNDNPLFAALGQNIRLLVETDLLANYQDQLQIKGSYPYSCSYVSGPRAVFNENPVTFITATGCPTTALPLTRGFLAASSLTFDRKFRTLTDPFLLAAADTLPRALTYIFTCSVNYCDVTGAPECEDYCTHNGGTGRRKRDLSGSQQRDKVSLVITVDPSASTPDTGSRSGGYGVSSKVTLAVSVSTVVMVLAIVAIVIGLVICSRKRQRRREGNMNTNPAFYKY